jgi:heptosyltransferase III
MTILLSRTDSIGDLVLTLPMAGLLKKHLPNTRIVLLASSYTAPVAWCSEHIDSVWVWQDIEALPVREQERMVEEIALEYIIHVFPRPEIAAWARDMGIQTRIGTLRRHYHWLTCNSFVNLSRKTSDLHEAQLNARLLEPLLGKRSWSLADLQGHYGMTYYQAPSDTLRAHLSSEKFNLILHPQSLGSAPQWSQDHWKQLIALLPEDEFNIIITGTDKEADAMDDLLDYAEDYGVANLTGETNLEALIALIGAADGLVAASTGPLHIAAALGKHALGLFAPLRPMHAGRWGPVGERAEVMSLDNDKGCKRCSQTTGTTGNSPTRTQPCACMDALLPSAVAQRVMAWQQEWQQESQQGKS